MEKGGKRIPVKKIAILCAVIAILVSGLFVIEGPSSEIVEHAAPKYIGGFWTLTVGTAGAETADYTCDGVADQVQFQSAMDALPAAGGKIIVLAGTYVFAGTPSRAINNIFIEGLGYATYITYNGSTAVFTDGGQDNWHFSKLRTDAGGITRNNSNGSYVIDCWIDTTFTSDLNFANSIILGGTPLVLEGATANDFEGFIAITDPTADRTYTLPDSSGEVSLLGQSIDVSDETNLTAGDHLTLNGDDVDHDPVERTWQIRGCSFTGNETVPKDTCEDITFGGFTTSISLWQLNDVGGFYFKTPGDWGFGGDTTTNVYIDWRTEDATTGSVTFQVRAATTISGLLAASWDTFTADAWTQNNEVHTTPVNNTTIAGVAQETVQGFYVEIRVSAETLDNTANGAYVELVYGVWDGV